MAKKKMIDEIGNENNITDLINELRYDMGEDFAELREEIDDKPEAEAGTPEADFMKILPLLQGLKGNNQPQGYTSTQTPQPQPQPQPQTKGGNPKMNLMQQLKMFASMPDAAKKQLIEQQTGKKLSEAEYKALFDILTKFI